ncbi:MAG: hypothetical protein V3U76_20840 [Granulosicoccus sp.]
MNKVGNTRKVRKTSVSGFKLHKLLAVALVAGGSGVAVVSANAPNSCPVDGCKVTIKSVVASGSELEVSLEANYTPDNAKNHLHSWWGEQYTSQQVGRNAKSEHGVEQGKWHRHDEYPTYLTSGAASTEIRDGATTLCITAADRDHNVIDADEYHCLDVSTYLN